jgi:hypothetical protein
MRDQNQIRVKKPELTNRNRLISGFARTYFRMCPLGIHPETMQKGKSSVETPYKGTIFGCDKRFQSMTSLQNLYTSE